MNVQLIEQDGAQAFRWGEEGELCPFDVENEEQLQQAYRKAVAEGLALGETEAMTVSERAVARELGQRVGVVRKDLQDSLCIAWWLPDELAQQLTVPGGQPASEMHCTLLYLGDPDEDGSGPWDTDLICAVTKLFTTRYGCLEGSLSGVGRFVGEGDQDVLVALVDIPNLEFFRQQLLNDLLSNGAIPGNAQVFAPTHGYVPHVTLAVVPREQPSPQPLAEAVPICLDNLTVAAGDVRMSFPLADADADAGADVEQARPEVELDELQYSVAKSDNEQRYTLGPLYAPARADAHGEFVDSEDLQQAVWGYVRATADSGRRLNLQHGREGDVQVGEWVEVMAWPYDHTIKVRQLPEGEERELTMPAGTVYMGVVWDEDVWPAVKAGKLGGLSLGGKAVRVNASEAELEPMGDAAKVAAATAAAEQLDPAAPQAAVAPELDDAVIVARAAERIEQLEREREESRGIVRQAFDALKAALTRPEPDLHVHMPATDLTVHTPDVHADVHVEAARIEPPVIHAPVTVNMPDRIQTVAAATRTRALRNDEGLIDESITEPLEQARPEEEPQGAKTLAVES